jgi:hypothetical protein
MRGETLAWLRTQPIAACLDNATLEQYENLRP